MIAVKPMLRSLLIVLLVLVLVPGVGAEEPSWQFVEDINPAPMTGEAQLRAFREAGGLVYFQATTPDHGAELYASDGTTMQFVRDFAPGPASSYPRVIGTAGGRVVVEAGDAMQSVALLALDRGSETVVTLLSGADFIPPATPVVEIGNRQLFIQAQQLWTTDGTLQGTARLTPDARYVRIPGDGVCAAGGSALFVARNASQQLELWRSDGSPAGTVRLATLTDETGFAGASGAGGQCYFLFQRGTGWSLWLSNGGAPTIAALQASGIPRGVAAAAGQFAYVVDGSPTSFRLWRTNAAQPVMTSPWEAAGGFLHTVGDRVVFVAPYRQDNNTRAGVFVSDGTTAGTTRVSADNAVWTLDPWQPVFRVGDALVFERNGQIGRIDTVAATMMFASANDLSSFNFDEAAAFGGSVFGGNRGRVWRTDGTAAGTVALHTPWRTTGSSIGLYPSSITLGDRLAFLVEAEAAQPLRPLWITDGTDAGTRPAPIDIANHLAWVQSFEGLGSELFVSGPAFTGADYRVYRIAGDFAAATLVTDRARFADLQSTGAALLLGCGTGSGWDAQRHLCALVANEPLPAIIAPQLQQQGIFERAGQVGGNGLFFLRGGSLDGLWRSDGTAAGTFQLVPGLRHRSSLQPISLSLGTTLVLDACNASGSECGLYVTDGTVVGTRFAVAVTTQIRSFVGFGARAVFTTGMGSAPSQLWISDLTPAGTTPLRGEDVGMVGPMAVIGARLHFIVDEDGFGNADSYRISDGSIAGTVTVPMPPGLRLGYFITALDAQTALFSCHLPDAGWESCLIGVDGANPRLALDRFPGPGDSLPALLGRTTNAVYLIADDGYHGREPWVVRARGDRVFADGFD